MKLKDVKLHSNGLLRLTYGKTMLTNLQEKVCSQTEGRCWCRLD